MRFGNNWVSKRIPENLETFPMMFRNQLDMIFRTKVQGSPLGGTEHGKKNLGLKSVRDVGFEHEGQMKDVYILIQRDKKGEHSKLHLRKIHGMENEAK